MPIFSEVIMKITDETEIQKENNQKTTTTNNKQTNKQTIKTKKKGQKLYWNSES